VIYQLSQELIQEIERNVSGAPPKQNPIFEFLLRELQLPFSLLNKGYSLWVKDVWKFLILYTLLLIFTAWFAVNMQKVQGAELIVKFLFCLSHIIPISLIIFSSPSSYCFYDVNPEQVSIASKFLHQNKINSSSQAKAICEIVKLFEKRIDNRLIALRGVVVLLWGVMIYSFNLISQKSVPFQQADIQSLVISLFFLLGFIFLYIAIESYAKVNDLIFKTAQFSCSEVACNLEQSDE
jgi:hypothetical protein